MANLLKSLKPSPNLSRNGFDLSRKSVFSAKFGEMYPCLALETLPDSHYEINPSDFVRTFPMKTDAFLRAKQEVVYFWIPFESIWHGFNSFYSRRGTKVSSYEHESTYCPRFNLGALFDTIVVDYVSGDVIAQKKAHDALRLLDLLGYGNYYELFNYYAQYNEWPASVSDYRSRYLNPFRICAYNRIWFDFYRNKNFDLEVDPKLFNLDYLVCDSQASSIIPPSDVYKLFTVHNIPWKKDMFMSVFPDQQFGDVSLINFGGITSPDYERWNFGSNIGVRNVFSDNTPDATNPHTLKASTTTDYYSKAYDIYHTHSFASNFSVIQLRQAEALQRWRENMMRSGQGNENQFEGRFGKKLRYSLDGSPLVLGSSDAPLFVSGVIQTANVNANSPLGDMAGNGSSTLNGSKITFSSEGDFGLLMGVIYFRPESEYNSTMIDKQNTHLDVTSFFNPEIQNLGLEAIHSYQVNCLGVCNTSVDEDGQVTFQPNYGRGLNEVIGYSARYLEYKTAVDKVYGSFVSRFGVDGRSEPFIPLVGGFNSDWVVSRYDLSFIDSLKVENFYINPDVFNSIFYQNSNYEISTDHLLVNMYQDIKAVQPMSVIGLSY